MRNRLSEGPGGGMATSSRPSTGLVLASLIP